MSKLRYEESIGAHTVEDIVKKFIDDRNVRVNQNDISIKQVDYDGEEAFYQVTIEGDEEELMVLAEDLAIYELIGDDEDDNTLVVSTD